MSPTIARIRGAGCSDCRLFFVPGPDDSAGLEAGGEAGADVVGVMA
jgi:hypothetical protein